MIRLFFGNIGSGKTTLAVKLMKKEINSGRRVLSNFDTSISDYFDCSLLETKYPPERAFLVVDESGIVFNNRKFKSLPQGTIEYFKLSRHNKNDLDFYSQSWDDTDVTIRRLASQFWHVSKVGPLTVARRYFPRVEIDKTTHQIITGFFTRSILWQLLPFQPKQFMFCLRPLYYQYFNSHSLPPREYFGIETEEKEEPAQI